MRRVGWDDGVGKVEWGGGKRGKGVEWWREVLVKVRGKG
jgi:hypothetical protein